MPTVLVVDDDEAIRESLGLLLRGEGYRVAFAEHGVRALEWLREHPGRAVVLFDYLMPFGDGLDLLRGVTEEESLLPRYAYICMAARRRSLLPGEFTTLMDRLNIPFVMKPFDVDTVLDTVSASYRRLLATPGVPQVGENPSG